MLRVPRMATLIITEKTSQARDLRAALGDRFGQILPAEGHLLRLAEPHEVNASWKSWACVLLKPDGCGSASGVDPFEASELKGLTCRSASKPHAASHDSRPSRSAN